MQYKEVVSATFMVALEGGDITAEELNPQTGEFITVWKLGLKAGLHKGADFIKYLTAGDRLSWTEGITPMMPSNGRAQRMSYGAGATESGANPDFQPSAADMAQKRLERTIADVTRKSKALDKRHASLNRLMVERDERDEIERQKKADMEAVEVIEAEPKPKPVKETPEEEAQSKPE